MNDAVFAVLRSTPDGSERVLALTNVSSQEQPASLASAQLGAPAAAWHDLLSARRFAPRDGAISLRLQPYDVLWLEAR